MSDIEKPIRVIREISAKIIDFTIESNMAEQLHRRISPMRNDDFFRESKELGPKFIPVFKRSGKK